jgi:hypothetical protein
VQAGKQLELLRKKSWLTGLFATLLLSGCQTASLEDAAPQTVPEATPLAEQAPVETGEAAEAVNQPGADGPPEATVIRSNPGFTSIVPIEKTVPVEQKEFVTGGARRTGRYPSFGEQPKAATAQMSEAERIAAEAEMTELLKARASSPGARAQYEARLRELRALAKSHARETQEIIEN